MIVREILDNPDMIFDYFNDSKDTIRWLESMKGRCDEDKRQAALLKLKTDTNKWHQDRKERHVQARRQI